MLSFELVSLFIVVPVFFDLFYFFRRSNPGSYFCCISLKEAGASPLMLVERVAKLESFVPVTSKD